MDTSQSKRKPYIRPVEKGWWLKDNFFIHYMLREGTSLFVSTYAVILLVGLLRLSQGAIAFQGWLDALTHPLAIAAFGRECTRRGVPPPTVSLFGAQFLTWRGIPLIPSDKVPVEDGKTKIILLRTGEKRQGVVGLFQPGLAGEQTPGLSVRFMGINRNAISSYLISLYCSLAVLTDDALAGLDDVEIGKYHDYPDTYK